MPKVNLGWLKDKNGEKFAPKTVTTQVLDDTGKKNLKEILEDTEEKIEEKIEQEIKNKIDSPTTAKVGQMLIIKEVDEYGKPIEWECVERPCYMEEEILFEDTVTLTLSDSGSYYTYNFGETEHPSLEQGEKYKIDTVYGSIICVCWDEVGTNTIGGGVDGVNIYVHDDYLEDYRYDINVYFNTNLGTNLDFYIKISKISNIKELDEIYLPATFIEKPENNVPGGVLRLFADGHTEWYTGLVESATLGNYVKTTQYATTSKAGLVRPNTSYGLTMSGQYIQISPATTSNIAAKTDNYKPLTSKNIDYIVKEGLGDSALTWTDAEKEKARNVIGAIGADDVSQSDWNVSDSNNKGFIKNRTHYEISETKHYDQSITIYSNSVIQKIDIDLEPYMAMLGNACDVIFIDGWSGTSVSYLNEDDEMVRYMDSNGQYYFWVYKNEQKLSISDMSMSGSQTKSGWLSMQYKLEELKQLDEKYIPDNIPKLTTATIGDSILVSEVDENGKPIKWTVFEQPCYSQISDEYTQVIFDEDVTFSVVDGDSYGYYFSPALPIVEGEECLFQFDDSYSTYIKCGEKLHLSGEDTNVVGYNITLTSDLLKIFWGVKSQAHIKICKRGEIIKQLDEKYIPDSIPRVATATVGQIIVVEEIDENGHPIKFNVINQPNGIEITSGEPTKETTVMTLNPNAEEVHLYTAEEVDALLQNLPSSEGASLDVQINGTSIVENGVANIPIGGDSKLGVFAVKQADGTWYRDYNGYRAIQVMQASEESINNRVGYRAISPNRLDYAVKAAMCDGVGAEWTEEEKANARARLGIIDGNEVAY